MIILLHANFKKRICIGFKCRRIYFKYRYIYLSCFKFRDNMQRHLSPLHTTQKSKEKNKKDDIKKKSTKGDDKKKENE